MILRDHNTTWHGKCFLFMVISSCILNSSKTHQSWVLCGTKACLSCTALIPGTGSSLACWEKSEDNHSRETKDTSREVEVLAKPRNTGEIFAFRDAILQIIKWGCSQRRQAEEVPTLFSHSFSCYFSFTSSCAFALWGIDWAPYTSTLLSGGGKKK